MWRSHFQTALIVLLGCGLLPTESLAQDLDPPDLVENSQSVDEVTEDLVLAERVRGMILEGETRGALQWMESEIAEDPERYSARDVQRGFAMVVAGFSRMRNLREVNKTLNRMLDYQLARLEKKDPDIQSSGTVRTLLGLAERLDKQDEVQGLVDKVLTAAEGMAAEHDTVPVAVELSNLRGIKAVTLLREGKKEQALQIYRQERERLQNLFENHLDQDLAMAVYARSLSNLMRITEDLDERDSCYETHQQLVQQRINEKPENMSFATQYLAALMFRAGTQLETDPDRALELIDEGEKLLSDVILANADAERALQPVKLQLAAFRKRAEGQRIIVEMIDQPSPPLDAEYWVNGEQQSLQDLKGQVVMLDFWAVWCRPCIATFPTLKQWNENYGPEGLKIVGVTTWYNMTWDEEQQTPQRGETEVSREEELEAIQKFVKKYELPYPSLVMPKDSGMNEQFGVTGIPHVVLIDKQGRIRMVKVGTGENGAKDIEEKIKELLAE